MTGARAPAPDISRRHLLYGGAASMVAARALARHAPVHLTFGVHSQTIFNLPLWIADELGFFVDVGLAVRFERGVDVGTVEARLDQGVWPIAILPPEFVFGQPAGARRATIVAGNANRPPHFLIAQRRFRSVADLRGARVGVISLTEGTTSLMRRMAGRAGLSPGDYETVAVGSAPTRARLLERGEIDAALQPFPLSYEAEAKGLSNLGWAGDVVPDWQFSAVVANREWLVAAPTAAAGFLTAMLRGRRMIDADPALATTVAARRLSTSPALARRAIADLSRLDIVDRSLSWSERGMAEVFAAFAAASGQLTPFDVAAHTSGEALANAVRCLRS